MVIDLQFEGYLGHREWRDIKQEQKDELEQACVQQVRRDISNIGVQAQSLWFLVIFRGVG